MEGKNSLIIANPGTGKTTSLAEKVIELLKNGVKEEEILCLTFTNKAANEMYKKIREKLKENQLENIKINRIKMKTFHSFANDYFSELGMEYKLVSNNFIRFSIFKSLEKREALNYDKEYIINDIVPKMENAIRYLKSFNISPSDIDVKKTKEELFKNSFLEGKDKISIDENFALLDYFIGAFEDYEHAKGDTLIDYNDMLIKFLDKYDPSYKRYKYVLVDELQDVNEMEANIAMKVGENLFLVGDRKQAIFGFQGGSLDNFNRFEKMENVEKTTKGLNYRSYGNILSYSKEHFLKNTKNKVYEEELASLRSNIAGEGEVKLIVGQYPDKNAVKYALKIVSDGKSCAIITRTNDQIIEMSKVLDAKGVEYSTTVSASVSKRAKDSIISFLKGIFYDDKETILRALFSPFSGLSLKDALNISDIDRKTPLTMLDLQEKASPFFRIREKVDSIFSVTELFKEIIMPISVSLGEDYYITASAVLENINVFFDEFEIPTLSDLLTYINATADNYEAIGKEKPLVLTTVHKAKGLEFDSVLYIPKKVGTDFSYIDAIVNSIIKSTKGKDVEAELSEEQFRVDFVAFTRAKKNLYIFVPEDTQDSYYIENMIQRELDDSEDEPEPLSGRYDRAYSLFVNKRYDESMKMLDDREQWLTARIADYFASVKAISFSSIKDLRNPMAFLENDILRIRERTDEIEFGTFAHKIAYDYFSGKLDEARIPEKYRFAFNNIVETRKEIEEKLKLKQISAEQSLELDLGSLFGDVGGDLIFKAKIDAVYSNDERNRFLILDFKTSKSEDYASEYRQQLAVYKLIFSKANNINIKSIETAIGYINLIGKINTGNRRRFIDFKQPRDSQIETVKRHVQEFMGFKNNPSSFIDAILKKDKYYSTLDSELYNELKNETGYQTPEAK